MKKRFLAVLLVLIMAISVLPFSAAAKDVDWDHNDKNKTCSVEHNWLFLGNSGTCETCRNENAKCNNHKIDWREKGKTLTIEPDCINDGYVITYRFCKNCGAAVGTRELDKVATGIHEWAEKNGICGVCGAECQHENWTDSVCDTCEYECKEHTWDKGIEKSECEICDAECLHTYENSNTCAVCEYVCTHATDAGEQTETTEATCTAAGNIKKFKVCKHCEMEYDVVNEPIPAGHTWKDGKCQKCPAKCRHHIPTSVFPAKKTVDPTCTEAGYSVYFYDCKVCGYDIEIGRKFEPVEATGHTWDSNAEGGVCSVCEATHSHEFDEGTTVTEATCNADGEGVKVCQVENCEYYEPYVIPKTGHTWVDVREGLFTYSKCQNCEATCRKHTIGEDGKCTTCGKGCTHQPEGNKVHMNYVPATCTEKGYYEWYKICKHCGEKYDVTKVNGHAPATGHKWVDAREGDSRVCRVEGCDAKCEEHTWRNGFCTNCGKRCRHPEAMQTETVTKEATCEETGIKTITCECGAVVGTEEIPVAEHDFRNGVCAVCGEREGCKHPTHKRREITTQHATCTRKGNVAVICLVCRATIENREIAMLDHVYGWNNKCIYCWADKPVEEDPNVPDAGDEGDDSDVTPPAEEETCAHENTTTDEKPATCENDGYTKVICDDCGETISSETVGALGHNYVNDYCAGCGTADPKDYTVDFFGMHIVGNVGK